MSTLPSLVESRLLRLTVFTAAYFSQGIPIGLLTIALPAWLSERGTGVAAIATYLSIVSLPWGLKLLAGPFMDRFAFPPMGRRRPWVMAAQTGLTLALAALMLVDDPLTQLPLVIALGLIVNTCAALQDVAIDGMAIDVLPESERGRANALMAFGQVAGFSSFSAISGLLLAHFGLAAAAAAATLTVATTLALVTLVRERVGERLMPWTPGAATTRTAHVETSFFGIFKGLFKVLLLPMSLLLTATETLVRMRDGVSLAVFPVVATQTLGYSSATYSSLQGIMGVVIAFVGIAVGPLVDRFGAKSFYLVGIGGSAATTLLFALSEPLWSSPSFAIFAWCAASFFTQLIFVCFIANAMTLCWSPVAASQFAIYMSLSNLARSVGSGLFAPVADQLDVRGQFLLMSALMAGAFVVMWFFRLDHHRGRLQRLEPHPLPGG